MSELISPSVLRGIGEKCLTVYENQSELSAMKINAVAKEYFGIVDKSKKEYLRAQCDRVSGATYDISPLLALDTGSAPAVESQPAPSSEPSPASSTVVSHTPKLVSFKSEDVYVPKKDPTYIKWGFYDDIYRIISSRRFFPVFISGLSGNGKSFMVEQACANARREYIRIQLSEETCEDDLIGGLRLVNGETVFMKGPVVKAAEAGAVVLLDEVDRASDLLMCLQGVMEGKPFLIKKTGETVVPAEGFTIIATGNSKGKGSDRGFNVNVLDEAFLERFSILLEQKYPGPSIEKRMMKKKLNQILPGEEISEELENDLDSLANWAASIRKAYDDGGVDEIIATRRVMHIIETYSIFKNMEKAIELSTNRYEEDVQMAFQKLWDISKKPVQKDSAIAAD